MFPKFTWYWSYAARVHREEVRKEKEWQRTNHAVPKSEYPLADRIAKRDGTNFLGVYLGMIAEWDGWTNEFTFGGRRKPGPPYQGVMMFSATSGELLRWISSEEFSNVYVLKIKPEYSSP